MRTKKNTHTGLINKMWNFQRIICIWICCVSCMFGTTQLSTALVQAVPYEYFDDHDQSFYDLDTEQIQAKYDTRLLSQQMLPTENLKGFHKSDIHATNILLNDDSNHRNTLEMRRHNDAAFIYGSTMKLKSNGGSADDDERNKDWPEDDNGKVREEAVTKAESSPSSFTKSLDELHLPRAASCFTNGQKYTHGQKVPRLDNCEVCLCMDGEIFCWWEKCDKKLAKTSTTYDDYSTPFEESSTIRMQLKPKTTFKSTLKPMKSKTTTTNEDYKYDDDDSAEVREMQQEYKGLKEQLTREEHALEKEQEHEEARMQEKHKIHNKQMVKKKIYQQQEQGKHNKKNKEQNQKQKQELTQQQQKLKSSEHYEQHHHTHNYNSNNRHQDNGSSGSSSKILNFPENLPSVLYYDYKTEEHHQHQHQHREQHLKHQMQKQQQHEKELKQRQQQKLLQKQQSHQQKKQQNQLLQRHHSNRHHEYGQVFHTYNLADKPEDELVLGNGNGGVGPSTTFKYFSNGNENVNSGDLLSDSDILPEPQTKKPKSLTTIPNTTDIAKTTGTPLSQIYRLLTVAATTTAAITKIPTEKSSNTPDTIISSTPIKKQILSSWDYNKLNSDKTNVNENSKSNSDSKVNGNNESTEDSIDTDDQDDAFHRWLTSPDTNNKNYFTFNESTSVSGGGGVFDGSNSDYNGDERNYENIEFDNETGISSASATGNTKKRINAMATGATKNIETAAASIYSDDAKANGMNENEQHFSENNGHNGYYINMASSNGIINGNGNSNTNNKNNNISPFSKTYENFNRNTDIFGSSTTSTTSGSGGSGGSGGRSNESSGGGVGIIRSTVSNEDNGVASVVNIDIMLTASSAELQQQQPQPTNVQTTNQQQQQHFEHEKQIEKTLDKFMQPPPVLISNKNNVSAIAVDAAAIIAVSKNHTLSSKINDNSSSNSNSKNFTNIVGGNQNIEIQNMGVNLSNNNINGYTNNYNNNTATIYSSSSISDSFKFKHLPTVLVSQAEATSPTATATALVESVIPPTLSTISSPERQCNVMGTLYKIGDVLPQDTGNCLQCICIDGSTSDDTPRVTCSPHNCPPLVLPDLFDATGY